MLPVIFAIYFGYMYVKDKDKRKLMFILAFIFAALSFVGKIIPQLNEFYFFDKLYSFGTIPIIIAVFLTLLSIVRNSKTFEKEFKAFIFVLLSNIFFVFLPLYSHLVWLVFTQLFGFSSFLMALYLTLRRGMVGDALFLLAITSFIATGFGLALDFGLAFNLFCYGYSFVFIALIFSYAQTDKKWSGRSFFKVKQQLDETKETLRELEVEYRTVFESASDAIFIADTKTGLIIDCNQEATRLVGKPKQDIIGKHQRTLHPQKSDSEDFSETFKIHAQGESNFIETQIITQNGELRDVAIKAATFKSGDKKLMVGVFRDITIEKRNQKDLANALKSLSNNLEKINTLNEKLKVMSSITRHDVRNKLSAINCNLYLLKKKYADKQDLVDRISETEQSIKATERILDFARMYEEVGSKELVKVNVEKTLQEAAAMFSGSMPKIINKCQGLEVTADLFLKQLFYNLIDNSIKHGQKTTTITVSYQKNGKESIKLVYEDDGIGIPIETKAQIFSQGFSTSGSTGLGLFLIQKMIEVYGWKIAEEGEPGRGATFVITIPNATNP